jgi:AraC-like DNA-binding protein
MLTLPASWLTRLDGDFFAVDYQITPRTRDADDGLRHLMRQLLVIELVNHQSRYRLEANRWLSEIALLLATRFSRPVIATTQRGAEKWSRRIASVVARIDANYQRGFRYRRSPPPNLSPKPGCHAVSQGGRRKLCAVHYRAASQQGGEQLLTTRKSVQQIAREQGFASTRIMSDLFKRLHELTPRQFRQQHPQSHPNPSATPAGRYLAAGGRGAPLCPAE